MIQETPRLSPDVPSRSQTSRVTSKLATFPCHVPRTRRSAERLDHGVYVGRLVCVIGQRSLPAQLSPAAVGSASFEQFQVAPFSVQRRCIANASSAGRAPVV